MNTTKLFMLVAALFLSFGVSDSAAQTIWEALVMRSKNKINYTVTESIETETEPFQWTYEYNEVERTGYEEFALVMPMVFTVEAYPFRNIPDLQRDMVRYLTETSKYTDSISKVMLGHIKNEKTIDEAFKKLKKTKGYNSFIFTDTASFFAEIRKYPDSKRKIESKKTIAISVINGIMRAKETSGYYTVWGVYDIEKGKRIEPADVFTSLEYISGKDTATITQIIDVSRDNIRFRAGKSTDSYQYKEETDKLFTAYAKSLMAKDKGYTSTTSENEYGDHIRTFEFDNVNGSYEDKKVHIPYKLNGCQNIDKIRNRMLNVMFGRSDGDIDTLVVNGIKQWVPGYYIGQTLYHGRGSDMLFESGDGLVSFGFEDKSEHSNRNNTFIVFDKTTGDEITVNELIKDKTGFMEYVNSFNTYFAGFLFDTVRVERNLKMGKSMYNYLKHSGGHFSGFDGLSEFPTSWWFAFNKMDDIIPVEFNTTVNRIFLNYNDIKQYIDPKYISLMDRATEALKKKKK